MMQEGERESILIRSEAHEKPVQPLRNSEIVDMENYLAKIDFRSRLFPCKGDANKARSSIGSLH